MATILLCGVDLYFRAKLEGSLPGHRFVTTDNVGEPELVIADIASPLDADSAIRSLQALYLAPILVMSARFRRGLGASETAARRLGVRKVLPKPFTRAELLSAVRESIGGS